MTAAPERIWMPLLWEVLDGTIPVDGQAEDDDLEYIRSDLVQELIRVAVVAERDRCVRAMKSVPSHFVARQNGAAFDAVGFVRSAEAAIRGPKP